MAIIERPRSIIPACDVDFDTYKDIVAATADNEDVSGYKVGFALALRHGLPKIVGCAKGMNRDKLVIYDHQKGGTDIPEMGLKFAEVCRDSGVDAIILFPQAGPETQKAWIDAAFENKLGVIVGGEMTHAGYKRSEGGYINDEAVDEMYFNAARLGVRDFVVPGNKPDRIAEIRSFLEPMCGEAGGESVDYFAPGFVAQGGVITEGAKAAGERFHAIVGRGLYWDKNGNRLRTFEEMKLAAYELTCQLYGRDW